MWNGMHDSSIPNAETAFLSSVSNSYTFPLNFLQSKQALINYSE